MTPYFSNPVALAALQQSADGWLGTPFHGHACVRGVGVDCIHLAAAILTECGHLPAVPDFGPYNLDGGHHEDASKVTDWLKASPRFHLCWRVPFQTPGGSYLMPGDVLCFRLGRVPWHVGLFIGGKDFIEVHQNLARTGKAELRNVEEPTWKNALRAVWRPINQH